MPDPIAVLIRFSGDPDELLERFESARRAWADAQPADYEHPVFYAVCRTDDGIAVVTAWRAAISHRAFGQGMHAHIGASGMPKPDRIERMQVKKLGWD